MDHNMRTLSGKGSLHAMGIICSTAHKNSSMYIKIPPLTAEKIAKSCNVMKNKDTKLKEYITLETTG